MVPHTEVFFLHAKVQQPFETEIAPVFKPLQISARLAEKLQLHLLKFPCSEYEVARSNFVSEGLSYLTDSKGNLFPCGPLDVLEVDKYALSGFRSHIYLSGTVLRDSLVGFKHEVELSYIGEIALPAARTLNALLPDI